MYSVFLRSGKGACGLVHPRRLDFVFACVRVCVCVYVCVCAFTDHNSSKTKFIFARWEAILYITFALCKNTLSANDSTFEILCQELFY